MNQDLNGLHDITLPEPVSWMPQTTGWLVLLGLIVALGAWLAFAKYRRHKANRYRRLALLELAEIAAAFDERDTRAKSVVQSRILIKRVALSAWPREEVASLTGDAWLEFLDRSYGDRGFTTGPGRQLYQNPYGPDPSADLLEQHRDELFALLSRWIRRHRN